MSVNVFTFICGSSDEAVTLFASDRAQARNMFIEWGGLRGFDVLQLEYQVAQLDECDLAMQPQLAAAASSGATGVGSWLGHRGGWAITPASDEPLGLPAPPEPDVRCYVVAGEDCGQLYVFAETLERAIATYDLWSLDRNGWQGEYDRIHEISRWLLTGPKITLREEMDEGLTGVAGVCEDGFWRIFPADYDAPLQRRPKGND
jgi:hypothetical protein